MSDEKTGKAPFYFTYLPCYVPSTHNASTPLAPPDAGFTDPMNMRPEAGLRQGLIKEPVEPESPTAATSPDSSESCSPRPSSSIVSKSEFKGRKIYDTWSQEEKQLLVHLWIGHYESLQRKKDTKKTWQKISETLNTRLGSSKGTEKCTKKMKYLIERYREAKDASSKRTDGFARKSEFYDEINSVLDASSSRTDLYTVQLPKNVVTFRHFVEPPINPPPSTTAEAERQLSLSAESSRLLHVTRPPEQLVVSPQAEVPIFEGRNSTNEAGDQVGEGGQIPKQDARTERKKSGKKRKAEEDDDEERRMLKETFEKFQEQGDRMVRCMESFSEIQKQQVQMMNHFLGSMVQLMQSNTD